MAQPAGPRGAFRVALPPGAPVELISADWGQSSASPRGGALLVDLHSTLVLRNASPRKIRAVSLAVVAQEVAPGGKGSVTAPSLDVAPGEQFPMRIDLRLMRPLAAGADALVEVGLDGVLFDDLTFFGPNRMRGRRSMLAWEMEARRDRRMLASALARGGEAALRGELLEALAKGGNGGLLPVQAARALPATNVPPGRVAEFAFLRLPDAPVELAGGDAVLAGTEARAARIEIQSRTNRPVRYVEVGWLARDEGGRWLPAGTLPAEVSLLPGQRLEVRNENRVRFPRPVAGLTAYPAVVEFATGDVWVPPAAAYAAPALREALPVSGEMMRLAELYRRKGLDAVVQQLRAMR